MFQPIDDTTSSETCETKSFLEVLTGSPAVIHTRTSSVEVQTEPVVIHARTSSVVPRTTGERLTGTVKWFNNKAGFGFITVCGDGEYGAKDIFVHYSSIRVTNSQYKYLIQGEYVDFTLDTSKNDKHEFHAMDVSGVKGGPIMCETRRNDAQNNTRTAAVQPQIISQEQEQEQGRGQGRGQGHVRGHGRGHGRGRGQGQGQGQGRGRGRGNDNLVV